MLALGGVVGSFTVGPAMVPSDGSTADIMRYNVGAAVISAVTFLLVATSALIPMSANH